MALAVHDSRLPWLILLGLFVTVRVVGALWYQLVTDCDQTFNYEEPTHYLLYGTGLQTWEYAPQYALRSYAYVGLHAALCWLAGAAWGADKIAVFHRLHCALALLCGAAEVYFLTGVARAFGRRLALLTAACLVCSAGMLHAAPAFLPSSFTMVGLLVGWGAWLRGEPALATAATVFALVLGWPFALLAVVPMGLFLLWRPGLLRLILPAAAALAAVCGACVAADWHFYRRALLAPWNIILYNAFGVGGGGQGSDLYGVEPASFYAKNLLLNFNLQALAAAASPLLLAVDAWLSRARHDRIAAAKRSADAAECSGASPAAASAAAAAAPAAPARGRGRAESGGSGKTELSAAAAAPAGVSPTAAAAPSAQRSAAAASAAAASAAAAAGDSGPSADGALAPGADRLQLLALLAQLWLWFFFMSARPHKEERFMFVVFPLVSLAAALAIAVGADLLDAALQRAQALVWAARPAASADVSVHGDGGAVRRRRRRGSCSRLATAGAVFLSLSLSLSRIAALVRGFSAPFAAWTFLARELQEPARGAAAEHAFFAQRGSESALEALFLHTQPALAGGGDAPSATPGAIVCVGKEWYRFPGHFFLPSRTRANASAAPGASARALHGPLRLAFSKSAFGGQLPQPFLALPGGTSALREGFNDANAEETDRYVPLAECDFVIDAALPTPRHTQDARYEPYFDALVPQRGRAAAACRCLLGVDDSTRGVEFRSLWSAPFVHADSSPPLTRAFFVPRFSEARNSYAQYHVLKQQPCSC